MSPARRPTAKRARAVTFETVRALAHELPEVEEGTSYGTPALKVKGKLIARLREDGKTLVVRTDFYERDFRMQADPETFFITDHYREYPYILVSLPKVGVDDLRDLLEQAWRKTATKSLVASHARRD